VTMGGTMPRSGGDRGVFNGVLVRVVVELD